MKEFGLMLAGASATVCAFNLWIGSPILLISGLLMLGLGILLIQAGKQI